eukprot:g25195.t1
MTGPDRSVQSEWCSRLGGRVVYIIGAELQRVKFQGVTITNNLSWPSHIDAAVKKAQQHLFFLRRLRKFVVSIGALTQLLQ